MVWFILFILLTYLIVSYSVAYILSNYNDKFKGLFVPSPCCHSDNIKIVLYSVVWVAAIPVTIFEYFVLRGIVDLIDKLLAPKVSEVPSETKEPKESKGPWQL